MTITFPTTTGNRCRSDARETWRTLRRGPGPLRLRIVLCLAGIDGTEVSAAGQQDAAAGGPVSTLTEFCSDHWSEGVPAW